MEKTPTNSTPFPAPVGAAIDPLLQQRLARLAARQAGGHGGHAGHAGPAGGAPAPGRPSGGANRARRRHAAKRSRAAALLMSIGTTAGLSAYFQHAAAADSTASTAATTATAATVATTAGTATDATTTDAATTDAATTDAAAATTDAAATDDATATPVAVSTGSTLADGTYVGATDTNKWGPVQVQITVSSGVITEVTALQTPDDDHESVEINNQAVPVLNSEALAAQSADIDSVSGATYTSDSYMVSLQSAIDQAVAAGATASA